MRPAKALLTKATEWSTKPRWNDVTISLHHAYLTEERTDLNPVEDRVPIWVEVTEHGKHFPVNTGENSIEIWIRHQGGNHLSGGRSHLNPYHGPCATSRG